MNPTDLSPSELRVTAGGVALAITWVDGVSSLMEGAVLRRACRCAGCTAARAIGTPVAGEERVVIAAVEPIGDYAVNIVFSDGHARGIFPWSLLRELAAL
jgi:prepilin-type processing-associated H-X9-DG protein